MATVIVLSSDAIHALVDSNLSSAVINSSGELVFTTVEGDTINVGAFRNLLSGTPVEVPVVDGEVEVFQITNDGSDNSTWSNRMEYKYRDNSSASPRRTTYYNEFGELRVAPAKHNTTGARFFVTDDPANVDQARDDTVPVVELMDNRIDRNSLWAILPNGMVQVKGSVPTVYTIVLGPTDPVPAGTPASTVIVRTT